MTVVYAFYPVAYEAGGKPPPGLKNSGQILFSGASKSCSKILKDKKYLNTVKNSRADSDFQGKRRLFKILNDKKYIFNRVNSGTLCFSGQTQVDKKY